MEMKVLTPGHLPSAQSNGEHILLLRLIITSPISTLSQSYPQTSSMSKSAAYVTMQMIKQTLTTVWIKVELK